MSKVTLASWVVPLAAELKLPAELVHMMARKISLREGFEWSGSVRSEDAEYMAAELRANHQKQLAKHAARKR